MASNDSNQLQLVANGTVSDGRVAPNFVSFGVGCTLARTGAGVYTITLDNGVAGDGAVSSANAVRVMTTSLTTLNNTTVAKTTVGGNQKSVFTVTSVVGTTGVATDGAFDFEVWVAPGVA